MPDLFLLIRFAHVLGAIAVGYYLVLPILAARMKRDPATVQVGYLKNIFLFNRIGQWILILQFFTGGYMLSEKPYAVWWIVVVIVVFLLVGALAGMMARPMKRILAALEKAAAPQDQLSKIVLYAAIIAIGLIVLIALMAFPSYR